MSDLIRILVADDHPVVRQGLATLLIPRNGMEIVGEAPNGRVAVALAQQLQPDVIMIDLVMPELSGVQAIEQIRAHDPGAHILVLTSFGEAQDLLQAINAGATGCLLKDSQPDDLFQAIRSVHRGQMTMPQALAARLLDQPQPPEMPRTPLTPREQEIMLLVRRGLSNNEIADKLNISPNTVRTHVSNILRKLNLTNRTQLAVYARNGAMPRN